MYQLNFLPSLQNEAIDSRVFAAVPIVMFATTFAVNDSVKPANLGRFNANFFVMDARFMLRRAWHGRCVVTHAPLKSQSARYAGK